MAKVIFFLFFFSTGLAFGQNFTEEELAMRYYQQGEYEKAATIFQKLYSQGDPQRYFDTYLNTLTRLKNWREAEMITTQMIRKFPANPAYKVNYGRLLEQQGQSEKAREWYKKLFKNLPKDEFAIRELSMAFYQAEAYDLSAETLLHGRKILGDENAFAFDLIALSRLRKNEEMLIEECLNILENQNDRDLLVRQVENNLSTVLESAEDYELLQSALLKRIQRFPQNLNYAELLAWKYIQTKNFEDALKQLITLDKRLKEDGNRIFEFTLVLISNKAFKTAAEGLTYVVNKGKDKPYYIPAKIQLLNVKNQLLSSASFNRNELLQIERDYLEMLDEFGRTQSTITALRQLAKLQAFHLDKAREAAKLLEEALEIRNLNPASLALVKLDLGDIYILTGEVWEATLLFAQVEKEFKNEPLGYEAKFRGAKLAYYQGDFEWAKTKLDILKGSTSELIANDALNLSLLIQENTAEAWDTLAFREFARADFLVFKNRMDEALLVLDSIQKKFPYNSLQDDILMSKSKIFLSQNQFSKAISQLEKIVNDYSSDLWADDALFMMGELYETQINMPDKAKTFYEKIITDYPGSFYVTEARARFRTLRGDNIR